MGKKENGAGSIRKRPDGTWEGRYCAGYNPGTGKPVRKSIYGKSQKEIRERLTKITAEIDDGIYIDPSKITLGEWLDTWLNEYCGDKKYLTVKHYRAQVNTHIAPCLGAVKLQKLTAPMIQAFYNQLGISGHEIKKTDKKTGKVTISRVPLATKSIRNIHGVLTKALHKAVDVDYIKTNPADRVTLPRVDKKEINPLDDTQLADFYKEAGDDEYCYLLRILPFTGLREAEATGLTWDCIDFSKGTITVKQQLIKRPAADGGFTISETKNSKPRVVRPADMVMQLLKARQRQQIEQRLQAGEQWQGWQNETERKTALVFTTATGGNLSPQTVYNHAKKVLDRVGAGDRCVHDLRHTYAVISLQNGDDIKTVQGNLGHATAAFTLDVYGHVSETMKKNSADRMNDYMKRQIV